MSFLIFGFFIWIWLCASLCAVLRTVPGRGYGILPSYSTHRWSGPSLWAYGPLNTALMSAMLYTHTAEPRKMELRRKCKQEIRLKMHMWKKQKKLILVWWIVSIPRGCEDSIYYGVFVISGRKHKDVLYKNKGRKMKAICFFYFIYSTQKRLQLSHVIYFSWLSFSLLFI